MHKGKKHASKNSNVTLGDFISLTASLFDSLAQLDRKSHLLVDRCGKMVASSSCGAAILADGRFLRLQDGHLLTCRNAHRKAFQMLLMVPGGKVETAALRSEPDDDLLVVRAVAFDETLLCLSLTSSNGAKEYNLPDLGKLFGLTPSEAGIVCDLYHGRTPAGSPNITATRSTRSARISAIAMTRWGSVAGKSCGAC